MNSVEADMNAVEAKLREEFSEPVFSDEDNKLLSRPLTEEEIQDLLSMIRPFAELAHGVVQFPGKMTNTDKEELIVVLKDFDISVERVEIIPPKRPVLPDPLSWMIPDDAHWQAFVGEVPFEDDAFRNMLDAFLAGYPAKFEDVLRDREKENNEKAQKSMIQEDYWRYIRRPALEVEDAMMAIGAIALHLERPDSDDPNGKHWFNHGQKAIPILKRILPFLSRYEILGFKPGEKGTLCVYAEQA